MQEISLKTWLNASEDWSTEVNGLRYEHISAEIMESLVETSMLMTEQSLAEASTQLPQ